jgi:hypothetical protein
MGKEEGGRAVPSALQLTASLTFASFTQKLLETTQVSTIFFSVVSAFFLFCYRGRGLGGQGNGCMIWCTTRTQRGTQSPGLYHSHLHPQRLHSFAAAYSHQQLRSHQQQGT